jgi:hypothetical protein
MTKWLGLPSRPERFIVRPWAQSAGLDGNRLPIEKSLFTICCDETTEVATPVARPLTVRTAWQLHGKLRQTVAWQLDT